MPPVLESSGLAGRKQEHLELALTGRAEAPAVAPGWADVHLVHEALPDVDLERTGTAVELLGRRLALPLVIAGMTGGHEGAVEINATLARAAERHGLAMGVGSQRAALAEPALERTYAAAREAAPGAFLIGNIGVAQLVDQDGGKALTLADARRAVDMIAADALAVHLNFLEESVQPEGDRNARGAAAALRALAADLGVPVLAKETGAGMSRRTAVRLRELGVAALDVGGAGGTNFARIEQARAVRQADQRGSGVGITFQDWGVPTAVSVAGAAGAGLPVIATGGIRSGLDAAKALALGATAVGVARPLLAAAVQGPDAVDAWIIQFRTELRTALFLTGSADVAALRRAPAVVTGTTRTWLDDLGYRGRSV